METLLPLLTAMAATDAPTAERKERAGGLSEFPNEEPSEKELDDWLKDNGPVLRKAHGALMRGETPPELVKYDRLDELNAAFKIEVKSARFFLGNNVDVMAQDAAP